ncbi:GIY-YIG nuclease family protein [Marinicellulosiphila megalodicopiae]|uniref:GIY-YIG nuclease family protein n=1 Tax=Marinicellulosiphila megalodicopiae TaxID=2724896 RepID=UPI003BB083CD
MKENTILKQDSQKTWFVYLLYCADQSLYCGITTDLNRRLNEHNSDNVKAAKYTRARRPITLAFNLECKNRSEASKQEYRIKKLTRKQKLELIAQNTV